MPPEALPVPEGGRAGGFQDGLDAILQKLKDAYGLDRLEPAHGMGGTFRVGEAQTVVTPIKDIELEVTLVSFTGIDAVYSVKVRDHGKLVEEPVVSIKRGGHGIVEGRDGLAATYFFLLIHPVSEDEASEYPDGVRPPHLMNNVEPGFPQEADRASLQRLVVLECVVGKHGSTRVVRVLHGPDPTLVQAARKAVSQFRCEPPRDTGGEAIEAEVAITAIFTFPEEENP